MHPVKEQLNFLLNCARL